MFPLSYILGVYIPEDGVLHRDHRENLKTYKPLSQWLHGEGMK
jgi:hypothetical protein